MSNDSLIEIFGRRLTSVVAQREAHRHHRHDDEAKLMEAKAEVWVQAIDIIRQHNENSGAVASVTPTAKQYDANAVGGQSEISDIEQQYHRVMGLLIAAAGPHGTCKPRHRKACTPCNANDELDWLASQYRGPRIIRSTEPVSCDLTKSEGYLKGQAYPCGCHKCDDARRSDPNQHAIPRLMILCSKCGNKRCPHATDHELDCSGSNDPGQKGSVYE